MMNVRIALLGLALAVSATSVLISNERAQEAAPTLTDAEQAALREQVLVVEIALLRLQLAQVQARDAQMALRQQVQALDREGYRLERTEAGAWIYTPVEQ